MGGHVRTSRGGLLGEFPVRQARIEFIASNRPRDVSSGRSWVYAEPVAASKSGLRSSQEDLNRDLVLTHEVLVTFPTPVRFASIQASPALNSSLRLRPGNGQ